MIWARDSDNVNAETYLAYLDEEANNDEKEGSERVWIRWDTNLGRKVCLHRSRIVDKLTSRQDKKSKVSVNDSRSRKRKGEIANAPQKPTSKDTIARAKQLLDTAVMNAAVKACDNINATDINSNLTEVAASSNNDEVKDGHHYPFMQWQLQIELKLLRFSSWR